MVYMNLSEIFWNASLQEIKKGYLFNLKEEKFICLICGKEFEKGLIFNDEATLYEAEKYVSIHINKTHGSVFDFLLDMDKKYTGLTELQKNLLGYFYQGLSDQEIVKLSEGGSTSTIRNHRFNLREREKEAKVFLAIMEILKEKGDNKSNLVEIHRTATMVDERYSITEEENSKFLKKYFTEGEDGQLSSFPIKEKRKIIILRHIIKKFDSEKKYTEKEVNLVLKAIYHDYVTLRRYLIEYGFMDRTNDCSSYWIKK